MHGLLDKSVPCETFALRRSALWRANRAWMLGSTFALSMLMILLDTGNAPAGLIWTMSTVTGILIAITLLRIVTGLNQLYRCPRCGTLPYETLNEYKCGGLGPARANFMSPSICPKCGTRLR